MDPHVAKVLEEQDPRLPLKAYDLAHLKSGGPTMTISDIEGDTASCRWFDKTGKLQMAKFNIAELRRGRHDPIPIISLGGITREDLGNPPWLRAFDAQKNSKDEK